MKTRYWLAVIIFVAFLVLFIYPSFGTQSARPDASGIGLTTGLKGWPLNWADEVAPGVFSLVNYFNLVADVLIWAAGAFLVERLISKLRNNSF